MARAPTTLATQQALRDSEERLRLVRRATGLGMYEIDWAERRRYWSPELRALLRVPDDLDINTDADLLERIIPDDMRAAFRDKMWASLDPDSSGDYEDEHRITRFDGSTGWLLLRGKTFFAEGPQWTPPHALDRSRRRHHRPQARRGGERAACLHGAVVERCDLLDRSARTIRTWNPGAERLYGYTGVGGDRPPDLDSAPDHLHGEQFSLYAETIGGKAVVLETVRRHKRRPSDPGRHQRGPPIFAPRARSRASRPCIAT